MKKVEKPERYIYPAVFTHYGPGKEIAVDFPDLGTATSGTDETDAFFSARELLGLTMYGLERDGEEIPPPSALHEISIEENETVGLVDVYMPPIRLSHEAKAVIRTVTIPAWLNAAALERGVDFSQVIQEALQDLVGASPAQTPLALSR